MHIVTRVRIIHFERGEWLKRIRFGIDIISSREIINIL